MTTLEREIHDILLRSIDLHEAAGYSVLIFHHGEEVAYTSAGYADIATKQPISRDSIFRLYSQSKPITSAAVMLLIERGLLDVLDPVEKFLPGFANPKVWTKDGLVNAKRSVRIDDLLSMTAGLAYPGEDIVGQATAALFEQNTEAIKQGEGMSTVAFANAIGQLPLSFHPGDDFRYSTCADILGAIVEVVSGKPFATFLEDEFFQLLGMKDTGFWVPEEKQHRLVTCYRRSENGLAPYHQIHLCVGDYSHNPPFASGGAGMVSTLDDYARFALMLLQRGSYNQTKILGQGTVDWMTQPQLHLIKEWDNLKGYGYGKLMRMCINPGMGPGLARRGEYGWDGWLGTYFANFPEEELTILLYQNTTDAGTTPCTRKVRNLVLSHF